MSGNSFQGHVLRVRQAAHELRAIAGETAALRADPDQIAELRNEVTGVMNEADGVHRAAAALVAAVSPNPAPGGIPSQAQTGRPTISNRPPPPR